MSKFRAEVGQRRLEKQHKPLVVNGELPFRNTLCNLEYS